MVASGRRLGSCSGLLLPVGWGSFCFIVGEEDTWQFLDNDLWGQKD